MQPRAAGDLAALAAALARMENTRRWRRGRGADLRDSALLLAAARQRANAGPLLKAGVSAASRRESVSSNLYRSCIGGLLRHQAQVAAALVVDGGAGL